MPRYQIVMASSYLEFWLMNRATYGKFDMIMRPNHDCTLITIYFERREVNEDNVLVRNVLVEFEDSLKYVSNRLLGIFLVNDEALVDGKYNNRQHYIFWSGFLTNF